MRQCVYCGNSLDEATTVCSRCGNSQVSPGASFPPKKYESNEELHEKMQREKKKGDTLDWLAAGLSLIVGTIKAMFGIK